MLVLHVRTIFLLVADHSGFVTNIAAQCSLASNAISAILVCQKVSSALEPAKVQ